MVWQKDQCRITTRSFQINNVCVSNKTLFIWNEREVILRWSFCHIIFFIIDTCVRSYFWYIHKYIYIYMYIDIYIVNKLMKENLECPDTSILRPNRDLLRKCNFWPFDWESTRDPANLVRCSANWATEAVAERLLFFKLIWKRLPSVHLGDWFSRGHLLKTTYYTTHYILYNTYYKLRYTY